MLAFMRALLLLMVLFPATLRAQSTQSDLQSKLLNKTYFLRGLWSGSRLRFDAAGEVEGHPQSTSFTLAGIEIRQVQLTPGGLLLKGERKGMFFDDAGPHWTLLGESIRLEFASPVSGDYRSQENSALASDLTQIDATVPPEWQDYVARTFLHLPDTAPKRAWLQLNGEAQNGVTPPKVLKSEEPTYTDAANVRGLHGTVLLDLEVDDSGKPRKIRIKQPLGLGLDEQAVQAASHYVFRPATRNGQPVAVPLRIEINFRTIRDR